MAQKTPPKSILVVVDTRGPGSRPASSQFAFGMGRATASGLSGTVVYTGDLEFVVRHAKDLPRIYPGLGAIVVFRSAPTAKHLVDTRPKHIPILLFGSSSYSVGGPTPHWLASDEEEIVRHVMEHLYQKGHRRIGVLAHSGGAQKRRTSAWNHWLEARGIAVDDSLIFPLTANRIEEAFDDRVELRKFLKNVTAVFASHDLPLPYLYRKAKALGFEIPRDISVVGVDNLDYTAYLEPAVTTVDLEIVEAGARCFEAIHQLWRGELTTIQETAPSRLVVRDSVARPRQLKK